MNLKLQNCFISVHDHDEALAFYRDLLGLEVRNDVKYEGMRWTTVGAKGQPDVNIVLEPPLADPNAAQVDRKVMRTAMPPSSTSRLEVARCCRSRWISFTA